MKKIVVFGATGNTGTYLVDYLKEKLDSNNYEVIAVGRKNTNFFSERGIRYYSLDITNSRELEKLPQNDIHAVVMTAAKLPTHNSINPANEFIKVNVTGANNVFEYGIRAGADRVIYTQTMSGVVNLFGKEGIIKPVSKKSFPYTGDHALYVITKNTGEELLEYYHQQFGIKKFVFHIPTIYQYRENRFWYVDGKKKRRTFHLLIDKAINGETIELWGNPSAYKDLVYVKDYTQMIYKALFVDRNSGNYNVGTGIPVTLREMIEGIIKVFSPKNNPSSIEYKPDKTNPSSYIISVENAKIELGYKPEYDLITMLKDIKMEMESRKYIELRTIDE